MNDERFDKITKTLGSGTSRRSLLRRGSALFGGLVLGGAAMQSQVGAQSKKANCTCNGGSQTCTTVVAGPSTFTFQQEPGTNVCQVGGSRRKGSQEGTFELRCEQKTEVTRTQEFKGCGNPKQPIGEPMDSDPRPVGDPVCTRTGVFTPTGTCKNEPGKQ